MNQLLKEIRRNPLFWLLVFVPAVLILHQLKSDAHTLLFLLSILAIVPLGRSRIDSTSAWGLPWGSSSQIALFVAPVLVIVSYFVGPAPMDLYFWPGAVVMVFIATMSAALVTTSGRSKWFVGVLVLAVYLVFAMTLYLLPPRAA